ncbi:MAG: 2,3-bisphosphoglycerate-independent phosphoglycerate mutase, partial [Moheibacter sp.]
VKAAEVVDSCAEKVVNAALEGGYSIIILADHGNSDVMVNPDGSPNTQHSKSPVPVILVQNENKYKVKAGKLGDIAPTLLTLMEIPIPEEMTGEILLQN